MLVDRRVFLAASALSVVPITSASAATKALPTSKPTAHGFDAKRLSRIGDALQRRVAAGDAPGFLAAIMRQGEVVYFNTVGYRDVAAQTPMGRDTIFRIRSMTKPIISLGVMMLAEENKLRLTDSVARFLPAFAKPQVYVSGEGDNIVTAPAKRQIQIRNLLTHMSGYSAGLGSHPVGKLHAARKIRTQNFESLEAFCDAAAQLPLMFEPGTAWQYGISTDILGAVIEVVSGQPLSAFLQQRIFEPLGMTETAFFVTPEKAPRLANVYVRKPEGLAVSEDAKTSPFLTPPKAPSGGGGLVSTADDYLRFMALLSNDGALDGTRLVGPETIRLMRINHVPATIPTEDGGRFGLGFGVDETASRRGLYGGDGSFYWGGSNCTHFWIDPQYKIAGLIMTQKDPFDRYFEDDMRALTYQAFIT